jgi:hypothetical protein
MLLSALKQFNNYLLIKSYVRTRLSAIPECVWQWYILNPFDESGVKLRLL